MERSGMCNMAEKDLEKFKKIREGLCSLTFLEMSSFAEHLLEEMSDHTGYVNTLRGDQLAGHLLAAATKAAYPQEIVADKMDLDELREQGPGEVIVVVKKF